MDPNNNPYQQRDPRSLRIPQRRFVASTPQHQEQHDQAQSQQAAAAQIVRQQISQIYDTNEPNQPAQHHRPSEKPKRVVQPVTTQPAPIAAAQPAPQPTTAPETGQQPAETDQNPYDRTAAATFDWREYHTAW